MSYAWAGQSSARLTLYPIIERMTVRTVNASSCGTGHRSSWRGWSPQCGPAPLRRLNRRENAPRPIEVEVGDRGDVVAPIEIGPAIRQGRIRQSLPAGQELVNAVGGSNGDGDQAHTSALHVQYLRLGCAADLLKLHL